MSTSRANSGTSPNTGGAPKSGGTAQESIQHFTITREQRIRAGADIVWESLLAQIGPEGDMPDGSAFPMTLEAWPGGRWYRDLGNQAGHLWAHVQVIKPPRLLELTGPMFMSYPAVSHVQYRLKEDGGVTVLSLVHRAMGLITDEHREGAVEGWEHELARVRDRAEKRR